MLGSRVLQRSENASDQIFRHRRTTQTRKKILVKEMMKRGRQICSTQTMTKVRHCDRPHVGARQVQMRKLLRPKNTEEDPSLAVLHRMAKTNFKRKENQDQIRQIRTLRWMKPSNKS